jgi:uncharacterized membrane protein YcaP (DUF421 family)
MWTAMFVEQIPLAEKILRTVLVYALLAVLFRLTGKRGLANMNTFDFIVIFTVICDGRLVDGALRRLGLRRSEIDHAVRLQNGDDVAQVETGSLEPGGQLVLSLKPAEQNATKADIRALTDRLARMEALLTTPR